MHRTFAAAKQAKAFDDVKMTSRRIEYLLWAIIDHAGIEIDEQDMEASCADESPATEPALVAPVEPITKAMPIPAESPEGKAMREAEGDPDNRPVKHADAVQASKPRVTSLPKDQGLTIRGAGIPEDANLDPLRDIEDRPILDALPGPPDVPRTLEGENLPPASEDATKATPGPSDAGKPQAQPPKDGGKAAREQAAANISNPPGPPKGGKPK